MAVMYKMNIRYLKYKFSRVKFKNGGILNDTVKSDLQMRNMRKHS